MFIKHGHSKGGKFSRTYEVWKHIIQRCTNPNAPHYEYYGGRGITVCDRWNSRNGGSFENFLQDMNECPKGLSLDRINNNKGYYKDNCRWSTSKEQCRNRRSNIILEYNGKTQCLLDWSIEYDINFYTLRNRLFLLKWSIEKSLLTPVGKSKKEK